MTRLESLFNNLDKGLEEEGEYFFDPIPYLKEFLMERNDFMASKLSADCAAVLQAAASEFDNAEAEEASDEAGQAFDGMFAESLGALAKL